MQRSPQGSRACLVSQRGDPAVMYQLMGLAEPEDSPVVFPVPAPESGSRAGEVSG